MASEHVNGEPAPEGERLQHTIDTSGTASPRRTQSSPGEQGPASAKTLGSGDRLYDDEVIPPSHPYRTLVLCFDGTGDQFDADNSNIIQLFSMLKKDDRNQQMVYYQAGIGTYTIPQIATPFVARVEKAIDEAIAINLNAHVMGGYEFLMQNYQGGDKICIFGFSRGAYTARALAGMIHKVGLLPVCNHQQVPFAYKMFMREDKKGWDQSRAFKKAFSIDVEIEFLGVWDTVASVGIIPRSLPFTASNNSVRYFRHALSLDEHRAKFKANHWKRAPSDLHALGIDANKGDMPRSNHRGPPRPHNHHGKVSKTHLERDHDDGQWETDVLEVWFAGCHCDVGGGSVENGTPHSLARIPLRWMIRQCFLTDSGIQFHRGGFREIGLDPETLYPFAQAKRPPPIYAEPDTASLLRAHAEQERRDATLVDGEPVPCTSMKSEEEEDLADALSPIYDELVINKAWWILEALPMRHWHREDNGKYTTQIRPNWGNPRKISKGIDFLVHRTVKIRMEAEGLEDGKYVPKAKFPYEPVLNYDRQQRAEIRAALRNGMTPKVIKEIFGPGSSTISRIKTNTMGDDLSQDPMYLSGTFSAVVDGKNNASRGDGDSGEAAKVVEDNVGSIPASDGKSQATASACLRGSGTPGRGRGIGARGQVPPKGRGDAPPQDKKVNSDTICPQPEVIKVSDDDAKDLIDPVREFLRDLDLESDAHVEEMKVVGISCTDHIAQLKSLSKTMLDAMFNQKSQMGTKLLANGFSEFELVVMCDKVSSMP
ncbi:hypothetical protein EWM64_g1791 [Hericium alpestre]|uniref:T6SS Phospholipase effector Tle1-like catalytic domain-containing protein n=1 Tax=Hericium alpestre TaxID=135208 RepID=A0A4Z0A8F8_9AGAM|nr:hypothetical protein EWM64_g1791 [Hericium alpestre]